MKDAGKIKKQEGVARDKMVTQCVCIKLENRKGEIFFFFSAKGKS